MILIWLGGTNSLGRFVAGSYRSGPSAGEGCLIWEVAPRAFSVRAQAPGVVLGGGGVAPLGCAEVGYCALTAITGGGRLVCPLASVMRSVMVFEGVPKVYVKDAVGADYGAVRLPDVVVIGCIGPAVGAALRYANGPVAHTVYRDGLVVRARFAAAGKGEGGGGRDGGGDGDGCRRGGGQSGGVGHAQRDHVVAGLKLAVNVGRVVRLTLLIEPSVCEGAGAGL